MNNSLRLLIAGISLIILALFSDQIFSNLKYGKKDVEKFQKELEKKYSFLDNSIDILFKTGKIGPIDKFTEKGISFLVYKDNRLINYTSNSLSFPDFYDSVYFGSKLIFSCNAWYALKTYKFNNYNAVGLILIKKEYSYANQYLKDGFQKSFRLPASILIQIEKSKAVYPVYNQNGDYIFSLVVNNTLKYPWLKKNLASVFYLLSFVIILFFLTTIIKRVPNPVHRNWTIVAIAFLFLGFRIFQTVFRFPSGLYNNELFSPVSFANSELLPSLGDLFLNSILIVYIITRFNKDFFIPERLYSGKIKNENSLPVALIVGLVMYYLFINHLFTSLIVNSNISFEAYKITALNLFSIVGLVIIGILYTGLVLIIDKIAFVSKNNIRVEKLVVIFSIALIGGIVLLYLRGIRIDPYAVLFFFLFFTFIVIIRYKRDDLKNYSIQVILVLLFSIYSVYYISTTTIQKDRQNMRILVENLATEHDPIAELLLEEMSPEVTSDTTLAEMLFNLNISYPTINNYLRNNYFNGYLGRYDFRFYDCRPLDSVIFDMPSEYKYQCYDYFNSYINDQGMMLPNSRFYFLDNPNGRINYLGKFTYKSKSHVIKEISLFIELESRLVSEEFGYPELLLDNKLDKNSYLSEYSYAKYHNNNLITQSGDFHYSLTRDIYKEGEKEFSFLRFDNYDHLVYNVDNENTIILSKPSITFFNSLVSFSYIFVFYYVLLLLVLVCYNLAKSDKRIELNFKNKIQFSIISILLLSLILIGGGTIYFSLEQYQKKNYDNISEKIQSVYIELDHKLAYEDKLTEDWASENYENLDQLLQKFSDVFYTDINLFDPSGNLIATSRPEIFDRGLTGIKMNPIALNNMTIEKKAEYVHRENIGNLYFLSAYVPFLNANNQLLAYLNLPYFTKEELLKQEITTLTVAIINIYVLLILITIAVAIFISDTITKPLRLLQEKFGQIKLLKNHELIEYTGSDEVASLVQEYNRMVQELQKSAELLAKSERESAWREMARQIAHEIKNPLTPMRLTIQHLQRAWKDKKENYAEIQEKVTRTLIEQIDNLSKIASEFSNFAQMPKAKYQKLDPGLILQNTISLFATSQDISISFYSDIQDEKYIFADKEQITRVFINLFNNAIQSIPDDRKCVIEVTLEEKNKNILIKIKDNGKGIQDDVKDKLFTPNFTTKTSGMGLGLAIIKDIVENMGGKIYFETEPGKGTTFFVELPEYEETSD